MHTFSAIQCCAARPSTDSLPTISEIAPQKVVRQPVQSANPLNQKHMYFVFTTVAPPSPPTAASTSPQAVTLRPLGSSRFPTTKSVTRKLYITRIHPFNFHSGSGAAANRGIEPYVSAATDHVDVHRRVSAHRAKTQKTANFVGATGLLPDTFDRRVSRPYRPSTAVFASLAGRTTQNRLTIGFVRPRSFNGGSLSLSQN